MAREDSYADIPHSCLSLSLSLSLSWLPLPEEHPKIKMFTSVSMATSSLSLSLTLSLPLHLEGLSQISNNQGRARSFAIKTYEYLKFSPKFFFSRWILINSNLVNYDLFVISHLPKKKDFLSSVYI